MVWQQYLLFLGPGLIMLGLFMIVFSIRAKNNGSTGIILLGPIPIVWGGKNELMFLIPILLVLMIVLVFLL